MHLQSVVMTIIVQLGWSTRADRTVAQDSVVPLIHGLVSLTTHHVARIKSVVHALVCDALLLICYHLPSEPKCITVVIDSFLVKISLRCVV